MSGAQAAGEVDWHGVVAAAHAGAALVAFASGFGAVRLRPLLTVHVAALALMTMLLAVLIGVDAPRLPPVLVVVFAALTALAAAMTGVAARARMREAAAGAGAHDERVLGAVGFTQIGLFDGFAIIAALGAGAPPWALVLIGIAGVLVGNVVVRLVRRRRRLSRPQAVRVSPRSPTSSDPAS